MLIGLIASLLGILGYFGYQPDVKTSKNDSNHSIDSLKNVKDTSKKQSIVPLSMKNNKKIKKEVNKSISLENVKGDIVISQNQRGGITAHTVYNYKTQKRNINQYVKEIVSLMKQLPIAAYRLEYTNSDSESNELALQIDQILKEINWQRFDPVIRVTGAQHKPGIKLYTLKDAKPIASLANLLW